MIKFLFGIHCHQPVGNFDHVFEYAYQKSYLKFIEVASQYPEFRFSIHLTGPLLEWLVSHHPEYVEKINTLVQRKQVEILISGFYEPVLASIPDHDRIYQILYAKEYIVKKFHQKPDGLWLTERVWDPSLVKSLIEAGIRYVLVDDYHFLSTGFDKSQLHGYFLTEWEGQTLAIFPIDEQLRYLTPFRPVEETVEYLKNLYENGKKAAIIFDDGEKFGIWPGTFDWVYKKGWLNKFIETILSLDFVETDIFENFLNENPPSGRVYLPTSSYFEMSEWSLFPDKALKFTEFVENLKRSGLFEENKIFVRGGIWQNFLVKYSESNRMHKKMIYISRELEKHGVPMDERLDLFRAQCNDAYWHGIFGGLYLPHLRRANYSNMLKAERKLQPVVDEFDVDCDGFDEIYIRNGKAVVQIKPSYGGAITELSSLNQALNFQDTLMRRFEHYHTKFKSSGDGESQVHSIHEMNRTIESSKRKYLVYDWSEKFSLLDHFLDGIPSSEELQTLRFRELGDFVNQPYSYTLKERGATLKRSGGVYRGSNPSEVKISKNITLNDLTVDAWYLVEGNSLGSVFAVEFNFSFPSANSKKSSVIIDGKIAGNFNDKIEARGNTLIFNDVIFDTGLKIKTEETALFRIFPIFTVSQSESGIDLVYQQTGIFVIFREIEDKFETRLRISILGG